MHPLAPVALKREVLVPLLVAAGVLLLLFVGGLITLTTGLPSAVGLGLLAVGVVRFVNPGPDKWTIGVGAVGLVLFLVGDSFTSLTIADAFGGM